MQHLTLINTPLFRAFKQEKVETINLESAYTEFIEVVCNICDNSEDAKMMVLSITLAEVELQHILNNNVLNEQQKMYINRILSFMQKIVDRIRHYYLSNVPQAQLQVKSLGIEDVSICKWMGSNIELVEMVYALDVVGAIDRGNKPLHQVIKEIASLFSVEIKDCYGSYTDIKQRKNISRTYFLDKLRNKLNIRMDNDDAKDVPRKE